jgi:hypothetical protein
MVTGNRFYKDISKTIITVNCLKDDDKVFWESVAGSNWFLKNHIFKTVYLGVSWVDNITFIITKSKT